MTLFSLPQTPSRTIAPAHAVAWMTNSRHPQITVVVNNSDDEDHWAGLRRDKLVQAAMHHKAA
ncbi:hypothetical protein [Arthrobacter bambusae]|uniref:hypothetical protein n=1 Tax=Arthrobacter bambusae TaxID=1338426 RepID=UPI0027801884|nr:hypothetical protein [Arthrobacter bambusae]MDQ0241410.1 hypothetical protein [Arthrobacter bambusae]